MALGKTLAELDRTMTTDELAGWMAYDALEPFGSPAAHWRAGLIASILANINRDPKKTKPFKISDFLPDTRLQRHATAQNLSAEMISALKGG